MSGAAVDIHCAHKEQASALARRRWPDGDQMVAVPNAGCMSSLSVAPPRVTYGS